MSLVAFDQQWTPYIDPEWVERLDRTPFLTRCRNGTVSPAELRSFLIQHHHYSRNFTRYLCALISNLANDADRAELMQNLFEEMGLGGFGNIPHSQIYLNMMNQLGVAPGEEDAFPETRELIHLMYRSCHNEDSVVGLAALSLGAEAIVPHIYSQIVMGFQAVGTPAENLEFFTIHIAGDDQHAITLKKIIDRELNQDPIKIGRLRHVARELLLARARFFEAIGNRGAAVLVDRTDRQDREVFYAAR